MRVAETFIVPKTGIGTPDYTTPAIQEPWVADSGLRELITAGWIYTQFIMDTVIPAKEEVTISELTVAQLESLGIEAILLEHWTADSPNIYCRCYIGSVMVCSPIGCSPEICYLSRLTDGSLPMSCHRYDAEANRYGVICRFRKDIGRGYDVKHCLYNDDAVDRNCIIAAVCYQRKIKAG